MLLEEGFMQVFIGILPELLALVFSMVVAIISFAQGMTLKEVSIQTIFSIFIFYLIGLFLKNALVKVHRDAIINVMKKSYEKYRNKSGRKAGQSINYAVEADDDEISQLDPAGPTGERDQ